jgi:hypothetical protein
VGVSYNRFYRVAATLTSGTTEVTQYEEEVIFVWSGRYGGDVWEWC